MSIDFDGVRICGVADHLGDVSVKWPMLDLTVFASGMVNGVSLADAMEVAINAWNDVCGVRIRMSTNRNTANLVVGVGRMDGPGNVLAQNELPVGFFGPQNVRQLQGLYDESENVVLAENPPQGKLDLGRIGTHELGHFLGIGHITEGNLMAAMYSSRIRLPQNGDILEARARYGSPGPIAPPPTPTVPVASNGFTLSAMEAVDAAGKRYRTELNWRPVA